MAITYNGTPVTSVLMNGVTYTTIADENGLLYYACNPVCYYSGGSNICYRFVGFDYDGGGVGGNDYARAIFELCGCVNTDGYVCWVGGARSDSNVQYSASMGLQLGCTVLEAIGCGYCGINYSFIACLDAQPVNLTVPVGDGTYAQYIPSISAWCTCQSVIPGSVWTSCGANCRIYSPWVVVCKSDYVGLTCQSLIAISAPTILPYCTCISAHLKNETGCTLFGCNSIINPLGSRTTGITCSIQVC